jgi:hypothetical protein
MRGGYAHSRSYVVRFQKNVEIYGQAFHVDACGWTADLTRQNAIHSPGVVLPRVRARRRWGVALGRAAKARRECEGSVRADRRIGWTSIGN